MTANDILTDVQCNITYMTNNAQGVVKALYDLSLCDYIMNQEDMNRSSGTDRNLKVMDLLRTHDTCARLVCVLSDTLDSIMKELDRLDGIQLTEPAPAKGDEKRNGKKP